MAVDQRRRQKKLERRATKRKQRQRDLIRVKNRGLAERLAACASAPVLHCRVNESVWDQGMGTLVISRQLPTGEVALGVFLVDTWCLGVKDAFGRIGPPGAYNDFLEDCDKRMTMVAIDPADARKLVEGAVAYARRLGLEPHPEYHRIRPIFGSIDAAAATRTFTFGKDGKPCFFAGPHDDPVRCQQILSALAASCGPGGYHFTVPADTFPGCQLADQEQFGDADGCDDDDEEGFDDDAEAEEEAGPWGRIH